MFRVLRDDFVQFAKSSKAIKALVEKETKVSSRPGTPVRSRSRKNLKIDKALAAFKVINLRFFIRLFYHFFSGSRLRQQWILGQRRVSELC